MRSCPRCTQPLRAVHRGSAELDLCPRCGGTFFDHGELAQTLGVAVSASRWVAEGVAARVGASSLRCPAHDETHRPAMAVYRVEGRGDAVDMEACPACGGAWLDAGEEGRLSAIGAAIAWANAKVVEGREPTDEELTAVRALLRADALSAVAAQHGRTSALATYALVASNVLVYLPHLGTRPDVLPALVRSIALVPSELADAPWTLLTHGFAHAGLVHLLFNMLYLILYGRPIELYLGRLRFGLVYLGAQIGGGLAHWLLDRSSSIPAVGASGAISGLMAAYLSLMPATKAGADGGHAKVGVVIGSVTWLALQLAHTARSGSNVGWAAHIGGFATGLAVSALLARGAPGRSGAAG